MQEYAHEVARQGQQGGRVATTAAPHPPQPQHVARSRLFQRASAHITEFHSGIARQLSEIDGYDTCWSTWTESKRGGNEDRID